MIDSYITKTHQKEGWAKAKTELTVEEREPQLEWLGRRGREELVRLEERQELKRREGEELRTEIMKIELHMVLDSWNEHLIKYRENTTGFSGIGLNELSISLIERVTRPMISGQEMQQMFEVTRGQLAEAIATEPLKDRLLREYNDFVSNDSQWIFYVQEAMELAFDLLKAMEMELALEVIEEIYDINRNKEGRLAGMVVVPEEREEEKARQTYPTEEMDSLDDSFESGDSVSAEESLRLRRKIEEMGYYYDQDDSFYD